MRAIARFLIVPAIIVSITCGSDSGDGNPAAPGTPDISGAWNDGTCEVTDVEGGGCIADVFRSAEGLELIITWIVTQTGGDLVVEVSLAGGVALRYEGTIDANGALNLTLAEDRQETVNCEGVDYDVETLSSVITGTATETRIDANLLEESRVSLQGTFQDNVVLRKSIVMRR